MVEVDYSSALRKVGRKPNSGDEGRQTLHADLKEAGK